MTTPTETPTPGPGADQPRAYVSTARIEDSELLQPPGPNVSVAWKLSLDGRAIPWWGSSGYPLARRPDGPGIIQGEERRRAQSWRVTGGRAAETRLIVPLPADLVSITQDPGGRHRIQVAGMDVLVPPFEEHNLPELLEAARAIHEKAPVEVVIQLVNVHVVAPGYPETDAARLAAERTEQGALAAAH